MYVFFLNVEDRYNCYLMGWGQKFQKGGNTFLMQLTLILAEISVAITVCHGTLWRHFIVLQSDAVNCDVMLFFMTYFVMISDIPVTHTEVYATVLPHNKLNSKVSE